MASLSVQIPANLTIAVKEGEKLRVGQIIARLASTRSRIIALSKLLEVEPAKVDKYLIKHDCELVKKGETLAVKKSLFSTIKVKSPFDGVVEILAEPGTIKIAEPGIKEIRSPVTGIVHKIREQRAVARKIILLETKTAVLPGRAGSGEAQGKLLQVENGNKIFKIDKAVSGKIVVGFGMNGASIAKIKALGGAGVILENDLGELSLPYIILEKTGEMAGFIKRQVTIWNKGDNHFLICSALF